MEEREDYYRDQGKKVGDFCLGFFGACLVLIVAVAIAASAAGGNSWAVSLVGNLVLLIAGIVHFFRRGRRYIAIGMMSVVLVPALLAGTCAIIFLGSR
jgi:hypothetical protein